MKRFRKSLIPIGLLMFSLGGCVVIPGGSWHRGYFGYYGEHVGVVLPVPVPMLVVPRD